MKRLALAFLYLYLGLAPASAQFGGCLPGLCRQAGPICVNSGHATAFLARTSGLDATHITAYTNLLNGLDSDGLSCKFDFLYVFATQDSTTALLNLISTSYHATIHGAVTFTADRSFSGADGSTTIYISTGFNPLALSATARYQQNTSHISLWSLTNATSIFPAIGATNGSFDTLIFPKYSDNNAYFRLNSVNAGGATANPTPLGHYIATRNGITVNGYRNGATLATIASTANPIPNFELYVASFNNNGTPSGSGLLTASASAGGYLDATQSGNFYTRLRTYMTAVGVP